MFLSALWNKLLPSSSLLLVRITFYDNKNRDASIFAADSIETRRDVFTYEIRRCFSMGSVALSTLQEICLLQQGKTKTIHRMCDAECNFVVFKKNIYYMCEKVGIKLIKYFNNLLGLHPTIYLHVFSLHYFQVK